MILGVGLLEMPLLSVFGCFASSRCGRVAFVPLEGICFLVYAVVIIKIKTLLRAGFSRRSPLFNP